MTDSKAWLVGYLESTTNLSALERVVRAKHYPLYVDIIDSWTLDTPPKNFVERVYQYLHPTDIICKYGNIKRFEYYRTGYRCKKGCPCVPETQAQTMMGRYGVEHALQSKIFMDKMVTTLQNNYGTSTIYSAGKAKRDATMMNKYGVLYPFESQQILSKTRKTLKSRIGVEYPFMDRSIRRRAVETIISRYGVSTVMQLPEVRAAIKQTLYKTYGVENASQINLNKESFAKFNDDADFTRVYRELDSTKAISVYYGVSISSVQKRAARLGLPKKRSLISVPEQQVADYMRYIGAEIVQSERTVIRPKEIDIYLPDRNIGIEFDGIYMHSSRMTDSMHLLDKTLRAYDAGCTLIHVFSDEWLYHEQIVKSRLAHLIGKSNRIYARCTDVHIDSDKPIIDEFLGKNFLGPVMQYDVSVSLRYNGRVVSVMTFRLCDTHNELVQFCVECGTTVVGGPSKLLRHFCRSHSNAIMAQSDIRWGAGRMFDQLGFDAVGYIKPDYWFVKGQMRVDKHEYAHLERTTVLHRIYDCGYILWKLKHNGV